MRWALLFLAACSTPDTFELGYGYGIHATGDVSNQFGSSEIQQGDTQWGTVGFGWNLKPVKAELLAPYNPFPIGQLPDEPAADHVHPEELEPPADLLEVYDGLTVIPQVMLGLALLAILFLYRVPMTEWLRRVLGLSKPSAD
jgi:hypothetical protein